MHAAQRRRDAPQALLAHELVVALRHFDPTGLWVDVISTHVRHPELKTPPYLIQCGPHLRARAGQAPIRERRCGGPVSCPPRHGHFEGPRPASRSDESERGLAANLEPKA